MSKMADFQYELTELGVDPILWQEAREAGSDFPDYRLARDIEDLIVGSVLDRNLELKDGETLRDVLTIVTTAAGRWPLTPPAAA